MNDLYNMIFKRKSIRKFDKNLSISDKELSLLNLKLSNIKTLVEDIKFRYYIVNRKQTTAKRGEYSLLFYSEQKPYFLENAGYILAQIDLFLSSLDIGVCWYGVASPKDIFDSELQHVIMLAFGKCHSNDFRKDYIEFKRKKLGEIWKGNFYLNIAHVVRLAPSSCNHQPWRVNSKECELKICRYLKTSSFSEVKFKLFKNTDFSLIDMGIFMLYLEVVMKQHGIEYTRELLNNTPTNFDFKLQLEDEIAIYRINSITRI